MEDKNVFIVLPVSVEMKNKLNYGKTQSNAIQNGPSKNIASSLPKNFESLNSRSSIVGDLMWPIILFLKICGFSPLAYDKTKNGLNQERQYKIRFKSYYTAWSGFCLIWSFFSWNHFVGQSFTKIFGQSNLIRSASSTETSNETYATASQPQLQPIVVIIGAVMRIVMTIIQMAEVLFAWAESASLARFLNSWTSLEKEFCSIFPRYGLLTVPHMMKLKRTRNLLISFYVAIPSSLFIPFFLATNGSRDNSLVLKIISMFPYTWHFSALTLMEDVKVLMTYRILSLAFRQIREGISHSVKWEKVTPRKIYAWRKLVHSVRLQVNLAGHSQKNHQLVLIGGSIVLITCSVFMLMHGQRGTVVNPNGWVIAVISCGILSFAIGRLYFKILAATLITQEERLIGHALVFLNSSKGDLERQLEVSFLHDMIMKNPSVISFGGYVSFNQQLLLSVGSQAVTYLIVLMQFTNP